MPRIVILVLGLLATLLGLPADQADPTQWAAPVLFGGVVWGTVAYLRAHVMKQLDGVKVPIAAGIVSLGLSVSLGVANVLTGGPLEWILFGLQAVFFATVGDQALKRAGGGSGNLPSPAP